MTEAEWAASMRPSAKEIARIRALQEIARAQGVSVSEVARQQMNGDQAQRRATGSPVVPYRGTAPQAGGGSFTAPRMVNDFSGVPYYGNSGPSFTETALRNAQTGAQGGRDWMAQQQAIRAQQRADADMKKQGRSKTAKQSTPARGVPKPDRYQAYLDKVGAKRQAGQDRQQEMLDRQREDEERRWQQQEQQRQFDERQRMQADWQAQQDAARQANENRYNDILGDYGDSRTDAANRYDSATQNIDARYGAARDETARLGRQSVDDIDARYNTARKEAGKLSGTARADADARYSARQTEGMDLARQGSAAVDSAHAARYAKAMALLKGAGDQERADIAQQARDQSGAVAAGLVNRGLAGTTIAPTLQGGVQRDRYASEGRLNDRLRQDELNTHSQLSGDRIGSQERAAQSLNSIFGTLSGDRNSALDRLDGNDIAAQIAMLQGQTGAAINSNANTNANLIAMMNNQTGQAIGNDAQRNQVLTNMDSDRRGFMERREDAYPDPNMLMNAMNNLGQTGTAVPRTPGMPYQTAAVPPARRRMAGGGASIPRFARGGVMPWTGMAQVGETGMELGIRPNGGMQMYGQNGPQVTPLEAGTQVFNPRQTAQMFGRNRPPAVPNIQLPQQSVPPVNSPMPGYTPPGNQPIRSTRRRNPQAFRPPTAGLRYSAAY